VHVSTRNCVRSKGSRKNSDFAPSTTNRSKKAENEMDDMRETIRKAREAAEAQLKEATRVQA